MTKRRQPLTLGDALTRIADRLPGGWDDMGEVTRRRPGMIRAWADPDRREEVPVRDAIQLDRAWRAAGGHGAPLFEVYAARLDLPHGGIDPGALALFQNAVNVVRECGEASAALIAAAVPGADHRDTEEARRQVEEAIAALHHSLPLLMGRKAFDAFLGDTVHPATGPP